LDWIAALCWIRSGISAQSRSRIRRIERVVTDIAGYDAFYKKLIASVPLKNVTSRFAMEKTKSTTALPIPKEQARRYAPGL
jgi:hypothetical protein